MNGVLLIDKPSGWTSFDVVAKIRGILARHQTTVISRDRQQTTPLPKVKVGHTGTLDPLATGLLVLLAGSYCKRASEFSKLDKTYEVTMTLGATSTTGDAEGIIIPTPNIDSFRRSSKTGKQLTEVITQFLGEIEQMPPIYSAIKVGGQRAYKLARAGKEVKLEPRKVTIYNISDISYAYPEVKFVTKVSSGTYIRSLVEDIGRELGTGAYMSALRRTSVGKWDINSALSIEGLSADTIAQNLIT